MKIMFSELDGVTWIWEEEVFALEIRLPIWPARPVWVGREGQGAMELKNGTGRWRRYRYVGESGEIAFYDRVVDAEEVR